MVKKLIRKKYFAPLIATGIVVLVVVAGLLSGNKSLGSLTSDSKEVSPSPTIITESATFDEKSRTLISPVVQDLQTKEKYSFTIVVPQEWEVERNEFTSYGHALVLLKSEHRLTISGPRIDSSICNFAVNGDVDKLRQREAEEGQIGEIYDQYSLVNSGLGSLRLGRIDAELYKDYDFVYFNICQLDDRYSSPTWTEGVKIGYINLRTPYLYDEKTVGEAKKVISNIEYFIHE